MRTEPVGALSPATPPLPVLPWLPEGAFKPRLVRIERGRLIAPPSMQRLERPASCVWRNVSEIDPADRHLIQRVAAEWGPLTRAGAADGEPLTRWQELIADLRPLVIGWTADGELADRAAVGEAQERGRLLQTRLGKEQVAAGGELVALGGGKWVLDPADMAGWWRLSAIGATDFNVMHAMHRCRHCGQWFSLAGKRADAQFCDTRHQVAFNQQRVLKGVFVWPAPAEAKGTA